MNFGKAIERDKPNQDKGMKTIGQKSNTLIKGFGTRARKNRIQ